MKRLAGSTSLVCVLLAATACGRSDASASSGARAPAAAAPAPVPAAPAVVVPPAPPAPVAAAEPGAPPEVAHPYDEDADASASIDAALVAARADQKKVLIIFGANWCPWCRRLEHTLTQNAAVAAELERGFHVVHVDTGARRSGKNAALAERFGDPTRLGLPVLVVLTPDGRLQTTQETGALESGDRHDPAAVLAFLARVRS